MGVKLTFRYYRGRQILCINERPSYAEQESEVGGDEVIVRLNPVTGEIDNLEVRFFSTPLLRTDLPVTPDSRLAGKG